MHRPRLLILDEPTSGLDPLNQQEFGRMVQEARQWGGTVFLSSHILSEVEQLCSQVGIIREGRLVRAGDVAEIKDIKRYEISITFGDAVPAEVFATLDGVTRVESVVQDHSLRIEVQGTPDAVIKAAAHFPVVSLSSHEPSLEDIFLRYYEGEGRDVREAQDVV
jgi:ABC-2 type transport system ATP-binding protein